MTPTMIPAPAASPSPIPILAAQGAQLPPRDAEDAALAGDPATPVSFAQLLAAGLATDLPKTDADAELISAPLVQQPAAPDATTAALAALALPAAFAAALLPSQHPPAPVADAASAPPSGAVLFAPMPVAATVSTPVAEAPAAAPTRIVLFAPVADATPAPAETPVASEPRLAMPERPGAVATPSNPAAAWTDVAAEIRSRIPEEATAQEHRSSEAAFAAPATGPAPAPQLPKTETVATLPSPIASAEWRRELGDTVRWMAGTKQSVAELRLNPPELGPLQIVLTLGGDDQRQASISFVSSHADVRQAIEAALPHLRDMLAGSGIQLGDASVNAQSAQADPRSQGEPRNGARTPQAAPDASASIVTSAGITRLRDGAGLIDIFA